MKHYHKNPRKWTEADRGQLRENLRLLGDISGIVHDLNSDEIPCGNFRSEIIDVNACKTRLVKEWKEPQPDGTVAVGYLEWEGKWLNYRQVRWTPEQCERAVITANALGGEWDGVLLATEFKLEDLIEWGVEPELIDLGSLGDDSEGKSDRHGAGGASPVLRYEIIFTNQEEQAHWIGFVKRLKHAYPYFETISERIVQFLNDSDDLLEEILKNGEAEANEGEEI